MDIPTEVILRSIARSEFLGEAPQTANAIPNAETARNPAPTAISFSVDSICLSSESMEINGKRASTVSMIVQSKELFFFCINDAAPSETELNADTCRNAVIIYLTNSQSLTENSDAMTGSAIPINAHKVAADIFANATDSGEIGVVHMISILPLPFSCFQRVAEFMIIAS